MAFATFVQSANQADNSGFSQATLSLAFPSNNVAGNLLFVSCGWYNNNSSPTITDTQGNTWVALPLVTSTYNSQAWYCPPAIAGANTVLLTWAAATMQYGAMTIVEWTPATGANSTGVFVLDNHAEGTSAVTITTTKPGDVVFGYGMGSYGIYNADTGWTKRSFSGAEEASFCEDILQPVAGSITYPGTGGNAPTYLFGIAAFSSQSNPAASTTTRGMPVLFMG